MGDAGGIGCGGGAEDTDGPGGTAGADGSDGTAEAGGAGGTVRVGAVVPIPGNIAAKSARADAGGRVSQAAPSDPAAACGG